MSTREMAEAMKLKLYEHIFGLGHDVIDLVQIRVYEGAGQQIPETVVNDIMARTQAKRRNNLHNNKDDTPVHPQSTEESDRAVSGTEKRDTTQQDSKKTY